MTASRLFIPSFCRLLGLGLTLLCAPARAAHLVDVRTADEEVVMAWWRDGEVEYQDTGTGPNAFKGGIDSAGEVIRTFDPPLDTAAAANPRNYTLTSPADTRYAVGLHPLSVSRKTKVSGTDRGWPDCNCTLEHTVFLRLPAKLQPGARYTLNIAPAVKSDVAAKEFVFDLCTSVSEALHVNLIGYHPDLTAMKSADLYLWMGDGGARDYSGYAGRKVMLYNVDRRARQDAGIVTFWKKSGPDLGSRNLTASDVWNCDFSSFNVPGTYRLVVDGVGCSPEFTLSRSVYYEPFKTSLRGFFYMRIGEEKDLKPVPRQPRFIPGKDPPGFKVYLTTYGPFHPDWKKAGGDPWDNRDWSKYKEPGEPTNPDAWGGHSDACDWDRHLGHIAIVWDLLLPYLLGDGKLSDDHCGIRESGNGIPDLIDEARYEVDFWLRLRDTKGGYACGLNNPSHEDTVMYQAAASPYMAWANAANAAMLADAFRVAGKADLAAKYRDAAVEAWKIAGEEGLDLAYSIGNGQMRGRDLKFMAAAYLYNVTGEKAYEEALLRECAIATPASEVETANGNQLWGLAAYLLCARNKLHPIGDTQRLEAMKAAVVNEAMKKNVAHSLRRPSRRSTNNAHGWFQSTQEVQAVCVAHAFSTEAAEKETLLRALILEEIGRASCRERV